MKEYRVKDVLVDAYSFAVRALVGKDVFFAPNVETLLEKANYQDSKAIGVLESCDNTAFPFLVRTNEGNLVRTSFIKSMREYSRL